jgi:hypothetical protein
MVRNCQQHHIATIAIEAVLTIFAMVVYNIIDCDVTVTAKTIWVGLDLNKHTSSNED